MFKVITWGIPGTGMPEFTTRLTSGEIADLVAYVMTLGGPAAPPAPALPIATMTPEAEQGRTLFFDSARTHSCGSCHELDGWGVPVGPDLASLRPERSNDVRAVAIQHVITARPAGEAPFAALLVERTVAKVRVYDLTAAIPVLRSFTAARIAIDQGTGWRHADAAGNYTTSELETIAGYLRWRSRQRDKGIH
jgi:mono/diheme cytochrome c family protein